MTASIQADTIHTILLAGVRHLDKQQGLLRTASSIIDASEATDYQKAMLMLGAVQQKITEVENLHRAIDLHFRSSLKEVSDIIERENDERRRAAAELADKLPPVETDKTEETQDAAA